MVWMGHRSFYHSPTEGRLGCFQFSAITNKDERLYTGFLFSLPVSPPLLPQPRGQPDLYTNLSLVSLMA